MRRLLSIGAMTLALAMAALPALAGETNFSGGYGGIFTFQEDGTQAGAYPIGIKYRPDVVDEDNLTTGQSRILFFTNQVIREEAANINFTGMGYSFGSWQGVEFIGVGAVVFKGIVSLDQIEHGGYVTVGGYGGLSMPFRVSTQKFAFDTGYGWDGEFSFLVVALQFVTGL